MGPTCAYTGRPRLPAGRRLGLAAAAAIALGAAPRAHAATRSSGQEPQRCRAPMKLEVKNAVLQQNLERRLAAAGWRKYIDKQLLAVSVIDLSDPNRVFYAGVNDDKMMYAASVPKIAALLAVIEEVHASRLEWTHEFDLRLQNMIVASSNADASWAVELVGLLTIERIMRDPRYCFYQEPHGGLWVGKSYGPGAATNRDPLFNISHGATSRQVARFYGMLNHGQLVSPHWSFRILGLMSPPKHHHKFVGGLAGREGVVFLARKSGTWQNFHADSALIQRLGNKYVIVGLSELRKGEEVMRELARVVDDVIAEGAHRKRKPRRPLVRR